MALDVRPSVATVGVIGLAAIAVGLGYLALTGNGTPTSSPTSSPSASPSATTAVVVALPQVPLVVLSADEAWRTTGGSCTSGDVSAVEVTRDGGATWTRVTSPLAQVQTLTRSATGGVTAGGLDSTCTPNSRTSTDGGANWPLDPVDRGTWRADGRSVVSPAGDQGAACRRGAVVGVEGASATTAYVLCSDGTVRLTDDAGVTFRKAASRPGAVALARGADGTLYVAVRGTSGCAGTRVQASGDDGAVWSNAACVAGAKASGAAGLGVGGSTIVLVDGKRTFRSTNGGVTWTAMTG